MAKVENRKPKKEKYAFPQAASFGDHAITEGGLTQRQWLAGKVLAVIRDDLLTACIDRAKTGVEIPRQIAEMALDIADEIIATDTLDDNSGNPSSDMAHAVEAMEIALSPFAHFSVSQMPADVDITRGSPIARRQLTMGDCQRAVQALEALKRARGGA